ncbi:hypothetical protein TNCV_169731 [Trichonephila clavipes]|nr:hypothetical protein TNCV_169731 [Trichonephila clavipes]
MVDKSIYHFDTGNTLLGVSCSQKTDTSFFHTSASRPTCAMERKNRWPSNRCVLSKYRHEENSFGESIHHWVLKRKNSITLNSLRVESTSVSSQGVREKSAVPFEV